MFYYGCLFEKHVYESICYRVLNDLSTKHIYLQLTMRYEVGEHILIVY